MSLKRRKESDGRNGNVKIYEAQPVNLGLVDAGGGRPRVSRSGSWFRFPMVGWESRSASR